MAHHSLKCRLFGAKSNPISPSTNSSTRRAGNFTIMLPDYGSRLAKNSRPTRRQGCPIIVDCSAPEVRGASATAQNGESSFSPMTSTLTKGARVAARVNPQPRVRRLEPGGSLGLPHPSPWGPPSPRAGKEALTLCLEPITRCLLPARGEDRRAQRARWGTPTCLTLQGEIPRATRKTESLTRHFWAWG